ncbi:MAG: hypothetical protein AB8G77_12340 [Rhodothermales bacterium]
MARTEKYSDADYRNWIDAQVASGRTLREISPVELQRGVGGVYSRCQAILTSVKEEQAGQEEAAPSMPVWFREFVEQMQASAKQLAERQWMRVGRGINETIEDATAVFENRKRELEAAAAAHLSQVEHLEGENTQLTEQLKARDTQLNDSKQENARLHAQLEAAQQQIEKSERETGATREKIQETATEKGRVEGKLIAAEKLIEKLRQQAKD